MSDLIRRDIISETYECGRERMTGLRFIHIPTGISVQGPCNRVNQKDEYGLLNRLVEIVANSSVYQGGEEDYLYCEGCGRVTTNKEVMRDV